MSILSTTYSSPVGKLHLLVDNTTVLALNMRSFDDAYERLSASDRAQEIEYVKKIKGVTDLLNDYFDGDLTAINSIKVRQAGADFSQAVWKVMRKVKAGKVASYAELADMAGSPAAVRAAGTACGKNAIALIIPCHRIVKSDGTIGNYGYGVAIKKKLLAHEGIDY